MERRVRPVGHLGCMAVFHRVEVHVIHVAAKVLVVADAVFPVAPLPDAALVLVQAAERALFGHG
ncbi:hypothetical protein D3C85_1734080 [compost metagenome]